MGWRRSGWVVCVLGAVAGCSGPPPVTAPSALELARDREVTGPVQARLSLQLRSDDLGVGAHSDAVLILDRPGRAHLGLLGPLGGAATAVHVDGLGLAVRLPATQRHLVAVDADRVVRESTGGAVGLDDLLGLLVGDLPLDGAAVRTEVRQPGGVLAVLDGPRDTTVAVEVTDGGTPRSLVVSDTAGTTMLSARWASFVAGPQPELLLPGAVDLRVPALDLDLSMRVQAWAAPTATDEAFSLRAPPGWTLEPAEAAGLALARSAVQAALTAFLEPDVASDRMGALEDR